MSSVRSILSAMYIPETLWDELIKTFAYLKNRSPGINDVTSYKLDNHIRPNLIHLKVVGSQALINIPKQKSIKLNVHSWQRIFIDYERKNQYRVYNLLTEKVHITQYFFVDKKHLYHREALNDWDYSEDDWTETYDNQFADVRDFDNSKPDDSLYLVGENILLKPEKEGNDSDDLEQDITDFDDLESKLSDASEEHLEINCGGIEVLRRSRRARAPRTLYPGQITYGSV